MRTISELHRLSLIKRSIKFMTITVAAVTAAPTLMQPSFRCHGQQRPIQQQMQHIRH